MVRQMLANECKSCKRKTKYKYKNATSNQLVLQLVLKQHLPSHSEKKPNKTTPNKLVDAAILTLSCKADRKLDVAFFLQDLCQLECILQPESDNYYRNVFGHIDCNYRVRSQNMMARENPRSQVPKEFNVLHLSKNKIMNDPITGHTPLIVKKKIVSKGCLSQQENVV